MNGIVAKSLLLVWLALALAWLPGARAENLTRDDIDQSARLTDFLHSHLLPLVGAQVLRAPDRGVILYGFTATELGKDNAEKRTRLFLKDLEVPITNWIKIRTELASMGCSSADQESEAAQQQYISQQVQQYMNNSPSRVKEQKFPLIGLLSAIGLGSSGAASGTNVWPGLDSAQRVLPKHAAGLALARQGERPCRKAGAAAPWPDGRAW